MPGSQVSFYLPEQEMRALGELASRQCRNPRDQVRYILRQALGLDNQVTFDLTKEAITALEHLRAAYPGMTDDELVSRALVVFEGFTIDNGVDDFDQGETNDE